MRTTQSTTAHKQIKIAIVVQDGMKDHLIGIINNHKEVLLSNYVISTRGTAEYIAKMTGLVVDEKVPSGKDGGDVKIANMVVDGVIGLLIFLLNPMKSFPHEVASSALVRECNVANIPFAVNAATADRLLSDFE